MFISGNIFRYRRTVLTTGLCCLLIWTGAALGFHERGVADCSACHTSHNSEDGFYVDPGSPSGNPFDLILPSASDVCLSCHAIQNGAVWGDNPLAPPPERGPGNFVFLEEDNINDAPGGALNPVGGYHSGHNVVAPGRGAGPDPVHVTAPGGTYPSASLGCTSCHDPHGNNNYRFLWGVGQVTAGDFYFRYPTPQAEGLSLSGGVEARNNHIAYRSGMSRWCGNCHGRYHQYNPNGFQHPSDDFLGTSIIQFYNRYDGSADPNGGDASTAYLPEVPFEDPASTTTGTQGPSGMSRVGCISCHRAHGSSGPASGRWDFEVLTLGNDGMQSGSWPIPNPFADPNQKSLCLKCHANFENHGGRRRCMECHRSGTNPIMEQATPSMK